MEAGRLGAIALLLCSCAVENPLFGVGAEGDGGSVATEGSPDGGGTRTGGVGGSRGTTGDDDDDDANAQDDDDDETDDDDDETDDAPVDSGDESGIPEECVVEPVPVLADTFIDGTAACPGVGFCDSLDFGGTPVRLIGEDGSRASVYVVQFESFAIPKGTELVAVEVFVPLAAGALDATATAFPVPLPVEFGDADEQPTIGASTWSHMQYDAVPWLEPVSMAEVSDFGEVMDWAYNEGVVVTEVVDASEDLLDNPYGYAFELPEDMLPALMIATQGGVPLRLGLTTDDPFNGWQVIAGDAVLEVTLCQR